MFNATELSFFLMDHIQEGIVIFSPDLVVTYSNANAERILALPHHELVGKPADQLLSGLFIQGNGILTECLQTGRIVSRIISINNTPYEGVAHSFKGTDKQPESYKIILLKPTQETVAEMPGLNKDAIDALSFGGEIIKKIADLSDAKNIAVKLLVDPQIGNLYLNNEQMEYAVMSLLGKAINFSHKGPITLHIQERDSGYADMIRIENQHETIAEKDHQALVASFGKGTDKAKNIVEQHGGKLWLETEQGFAFVFSIPKNL